MTADESSGLEALAEVLRSRLPLLKSAVALNHAGIAPQPVSEAVAEFERRRASSLPGAALESVAGLRSEIRRAYARLLRVSSSEIAITHHTAEGVNFIAQGLAWKPGDRVLTVDVEYPSNVYPWWNLRDRGVEVVTVPERNGRVEIEAFVHAIDERVRLVAISHVEFASGFTFDLETLSRACRQRGIPLFVDIAQSIGLLPVDLSLVDAAAWPTWKWLMGPIGMGGLYVSRALLAQIRPAFVGSDGMIPTADYLDYRFELRPGAQRFEYSTENTLGLIGTAEALRRALPVMEAGDPYQAVRWVWRLGDELSLLLARRGFRLYSSTRAGERSGIFSFVTPGDPAAIASRLGENGVEAAVRAGRLRFSPHFYNNDEDLSRVERGLS